MENCSMKMDLCIYETVIKLNCRLYTCKIKVIIKTQIIIFKHHEEVKTQKKELLGIEPRTAGYDHLCSTTELQLPQ